MPKRNTESFVRYSMFEQSSALRGAIFVAKILLFPLALPLIVLSRISRRIGFRFSSECLSIVPFSIGEIIRYDFYKSTLKKCGRNVFVSFGTVFFYPDVSIGNNVLIGMYNTVHHCSFGDYVLTAEGCRFLSGSRYHSHDVVDKPMALQGGYLRHISVGDDVWIGANAVVMEEVGTGSIVGAGSIVTKKVEPYSVVAGNPARCLRKRK